MAGNTFTNSTLTPSVRRRSRIQRPKLSSPTPLIIAAEWPSLATVSIKIPGAPLGYGPRKGPAVPSGKPARGRMISTSNSPMIHMSLTRFLSLPSNTTEPLYRSPAGDRVSRMPPRTPARMLRSSKSQLAKTLSEVSYLRKACFRNLREFFISLSILSAVAFPLRSRHTLMSFPTWPPSRTNGSMTTPLS